MNVDLRPMKQKAISFPEPVKSLILSEPDNMDAGEFITKLSTWEKIIRMQQQGGSLK